MSKKVIPINKSKGIVDLVCQKTKKKHSYDFCFIKDEAWRSQFVECFKSMSTDLKVHDSRIGNFSYIKRFFEFYHSKYAEYCDLRQLSSTVLELYAIHLHNNYKSVQSSSTMFATLLKWLKRIEALNDDSFFEISIPNNCFFNARSSIENTEPYSEEQLNAILNGLKEDMNRNPINLFKTEWFDKEKYYIGSSKQIEFIKCLYINCILNGEEYLDVYGNSNKLKKNDKFYGRRIDLEYCSRIKFYEYMNDNLDFYMSKYSGKKPVRVEIVTDDVFTLFLLTAIATGFNRQTLLDMNRDSWCTAHPFVENAVIIQSPKFRARKMQSSSYSLDVSGLISLLAKYAKLTEVLFREHPEKYDFWQAHPRNSKYASTIDGGTLYHGSKRYILRHNLFGVLGGTSISWRKIRASSAEQMLIRFEGDLIKLQQFLNHENIKTTYDYTVNSLNNAHIKKQLLKNLDNVVCSFITGEADKDKEHLASKLNTTQSETDAVYAGEFDTLYARCRNPYIESGHDNAPSMKLCENFDLLRCLTCVRAVVFPEDLYKLFSFVGLKEKQFSEGVINAEVYSSYKPLIAFIENKLAQNFDQAVVEEMRARAQQDNYYVFA